MTAPRRALPGPGIVELWHAPLDRLPPGSPTSDIFPGENARLARLLRPEDRRNLLRRRHWLRRILALYCGEPPERLRFTVEPAGRPSLKGAADAPHFSLSRSRSHVAVAVAAAPVGLDIEETVLDFDPVLLAETAFSPRHRRAIAAQPVGPERDLTFVRLWTATEAVLKASGQGFLADDERIRAAAGSQPVQHVELTGQICAVALASGELPRVALCADGDAAIRR